MEAVTILCVHIWISLLAFYFGVKAGFTKNIGILAIMCTIPLFNICFMCINFMAYLYELMLEEGDIT